MSMLRLLIHSSSRHVLHGSWRAIKHKCRTLRILLLLRKGVMEYWRTLLYLPRPEIRVVSGIVSIAQVGWLVWRWKPRNWAYLKRDVCTSVRCWSIIVLRWFKDHALVVAFAMALALDAIAAYWALFAALDASTSTGQAPCLGTFSRQLRLQCSFGGRYV